MKISVINPNTTATMTAGIEAAARAVARPGTEIMASQPLIGPGAIEGPFDGALSLPGLLKQIAAADTAGAQAHIIACFDDTGLDAARALSPNPVIGIGEAAYQLASLVAHSFAVITTLSRSAPIIEDNIRRYGFEHRCRRVFATDIPVLELENPASGALEQISEMIEQARKLGAEGIVLGCAGMADFAMQLQSKHGLPVVDGVSAAVGLAETLVNCRLKTSKTGVWAGPTRLHVLDKF